ncbi:hypothetical protein ITX31_00535 [Arthrobacter gandavensis]|uniref:hypothetical protein n=1 Tax=Arthrobacter gandavensis TaxID=169960 RepID=UPI001890B10D|nr:hypothetical protein [Arthrobacter gandavensis]MBF4992598.1 hypothetical protein [Arthrobacter gandavensis]
MEFVVIVLFVTAIVLVNFLVGRAQRKRAGGPAADKPAQSGTGSSGKPLRAPAGTSLEAAREAAAQLDEKGHQQVYAAIAQGQPIRAIQIYARNTGCGLRAASAAVASMASHPVPFSRPRTEQPPATDAGAPGAAPAESADSTKPETPETEAEERHETAAPDAAARSAAAAPAASENGAAGKDKPAEKAKDKEGAAPDDAEISRWAQNLRPEDF